MRLSRYMLLRPTLSAVGASSRACVDKYDFSQMILLKSQRGSYIFLVIYVVLTGTHSLLMKTHSNLFECGWYGDLLLPSDVCFVVFDCQQKCFMLKRYIDWGV
eukprot:Lankesteria_metandrocarpae@DN2858_c0_g1_i1.p1